MWNCCNKIFKHICTISLGWSREGEKLLKYRFSTFRNKTNLQIKKKILVFYRPTVLRTSRHWTVLISTLRLFMVRKIYKNNTSIILLYCLLLVYLKYWYSTNLGYCHFWAFLGYKKQCSRIRCGRNIDFAFVFEILPNSVRLPYTSSTGGLTHLVRDK